MKRKECFFLPKETGLFVFLLLTCLLLAAKPEILPVGGAAQEVKKIAITFDDDVIIGLSQEISYKEAVSMI